MLKLIPFVVIVNKTAGNTFIAAVPLLGLCHLKMRMVIVIKIIAAANLY